MKHILGVYAKPQFVITHGKGCHLYDNRGKEYLDFCAGIAVNALGHGDKQVAQTLYEQAQKIIHLSNLYHNEHAGKLADLLCDPIKPKGNWRNHQVFFSNSGTEANEAAFKFARKYAKEKHPNNPQKIQILSFTHAFHGRTFGALSATANEKYQKPFLPLVPGFVTKPFNDLASLDHISKDTCAVIVEPIQGEGGVTPATDAFLSKMRQKCDEHDVLLIADEIQCGLGRSGSLYAYEQTPIVPDIMTLAKPIANGFPVGACIVGEQVAQVMKPGDHGTTFGGSPLGTCVGVHVVQRINNPAFLGHVKRMGSILKERALNLDRSKVVDVRGKGLLMGIELHKDIELKNFVEHALDQGLMVVSAGKQTIRLIPPLIIQEDEIHKGMDIVSSVLKKL
ncbi:acetylornithine aminotransferase apoenzyme [Gorgonomyces haynaldii]|nr:acetylornithine aminotransferase apoenzyme [Gorgonomyces haynaldii]